MIAPEFAALLPTTIVVLVALIALGSIGNTIGRAYRRLRSRRRHQLRLHFRLLLSDLLERQVDGPSREIKAAARSRARRAVLLDAAESLGRELPIEDRFALGRIISRTALNRYVMQRATIGQQLQRTRAVAQLAALALPDAREVLFIAMRDDDQSVRNAAATSWATLAGPDAAPALVRMLVNEPETDTTTLIELVAGLGRDAGPHVLNALRNQPTPSLVKVTSYCCDPTDAAVVMSKVLSSSQQPAVRLATVRELAKIPSPLTVESLTMCLDDPDTYVRSSAAAAIGSASDPSAIGPLAALLSDPDHVVRTRAAASIGRIPGGRDALSTLCASEDHRVAQAAAVALQTALVQGGLDDLASDDELTVAHTFRHLRALVENQGYSLLIRQAAERHPSERVRSRLRSLVEEASRHPLAVSRQESAQTDRDAPVLLPGTRLA